MGKSECWTTSPPGAAGDGDHRPVRPLRLRQDHPAAGAGGPPAAVGRGGDGSPAPPSCFRRTACCPGGRWSSTSPMCSPGAPGRRALAGPGRAGGGRSTPALCPPAAWGGGWPWPAPRPAAAGALSAGRALHRRGAARAARILERVRALGVPVLLSSHEAEIVAPLRPGDPPRRTAPP